MVYLLYPYHKNFNKRLIKAPKLYFYDTGLACSSLGLQLPEQLFGHYARGNLFENFVVAELLKNFYNAGQRPRMYFWRDHTGNEVDIVFERGVDLCVIEAKVSATPSLSDFKQLQNFQEFAETKTENQYVVFGGNENQAWGDKQFVSWQSLDGLK